MNVAVLRHFASGALTAAALLLAATPSAAQPAPDALAMHRWELVTWNGAPPPDGIGRDLEIYFTASRGFVASGYAGCNTYRAQLTIEAKAMRFADIVSVTRKGCPGEYGRMEQRYKDALAAVERFTLAGEKLILEGRNVKLEFAAKPLR